MVVLYGMYEITMAGFIKSLFHKLHMKWPQMLNLSYDCFKWDLTVLKTDSISEQNI